MDRTELRKRAVELYEDELQYAIARDDEIDLGSCRSRAAIRIGREMEGLDISAVWLGYVEGIARNVERGFEEDLTNGQLRLSGALRTGDLMFVPTPRMRERDWLTVDERHEAKYREHAEKRDRERAAIRGIVDRLRSYGGDPTTFEACPDLFGESEEQVA
jgi:hypothetical protein